MCCLPLRKPAFCEDSLKTASENVALQAVGFSKDHLITVHCLLFTDLIFLRKMMIHEFPNYFVDKALMA